MNKSLFTWVAYSLADGRATVQFRGTYAACTELATSRLDLYLKHRPLK
jgi:hypothetical protein